MCDVGHMSGSVRIACPVEEVFQAVVHEPSWNPAMRSATMLTPPPPGAGSRYEVFMDLAAGKLTEQDLADWMQHACE